MLDTQRITQLIQVNRFQEAHDLALQSLAEIPQDAAMHSYLGLALNGLGRLEEALTSTENAIALNPGNYRFFEQRGLLLSKLGRHADASIAFEQALHLNPTDSYTKAAYVEALLREPATSRPTQRPARIARSSELVESMLENDPDSETTHLMHGKVLLAKNQNTQAQRAARRALAIDPNNAVGHQLLGMTQQNQGNVRAAGDSYVAAGKLNPHSTHSRDLLAGLGKGAAAVPLCGFFLLSRVARTGSKGAVHAGVPIAIVLVIVLAVAAAAIANRRKQRTASSPDLSPEARRIYEANKKLS